MGNNYNQDPDFLPYSYATLIYKVWTPSFIFWLKSVNTVGPWSRLLIPGGAKFDITSKHGWRETLTMGGNGLP